MINIVGHRLLIKPVSVEEVDEVFAKAKAAGLALLENEDASLRKNAVDRGEVIQVGETAFKDFGGSPWCKVGDFVVYSRYSGKFITDPTTKEKFVALNDEDIIAVITD